MNNQSHVKCPCGASWKKKHNAGCPRRKSVKRTRPAASVKLPKLPLRNDIIFLLDTSASMKPHGQEPLNALRMQLDEALRQRKDEETRVSYYEFDSSTRVVIARGTLEDTQKALQNRRYEANGYSTGLFDAVEKIVRGPFTVPTLFIIVTDGRNNIYNGDHYYATQRFQEIVRRANDDPNVTLSFIGPWSMLNDLHGTVPAGNCHVWEGGRQEFIETQSILTRSIGNYYTDTLQKGMTKTMSYVQADVNTSQMRGKVSKSTGKYIQGLVQSPIDITTFAKKLHPSFIRGDAYYELTKAEVVQPYKTILLSDPKTGDILSGNTRSVLGVPQTGNVTLTPGNLKGYRVFIQSTSVNRKLVPGTLVLIEK